MWRLMWNPMWSVFKNVCEFKWHVKFFCHEDLHVKACLKPHVKCMWKYVWKGWHRSTPFSHIFHYAHFHMHVKYVCEINVKGVWKTCEESVKIREFSHVFHIMFHIHTPSSAPGHWFSFRQPKRNWKHKTASPTFLTTVYPKTTLMFNTLDQIPVGKTWRPMESGRKMKPEVQ